MDLPTHILTAVVVLEDLRITWMYLLVFMLLLLYIFQHSIRVDKVFVNCHIYLLYSATLLTCKLISNRRIAAILSQSILSYISVKIAIEAKV